MIITAVTILSEFILISISLVLWFKDSPFKRAYRYLSLAFSFLAVVNLVLLFLYHVHSRNLHYLVSWYYPFDHILIMFIGPCIYFFVLLLFDSKRRITPRQYFLHALPALPALVYICYFASLPLPERIGMLTDDANPGRWMDDVLDNMFYLQNLLYLAGSYLKVYKLRKSDYLITTNGYQTNIRVLHYFLSVALACMIIYIPLCDLQYCNTVQLIWGSCLLAVPVIYIIVHSQFTTGLCLHRIEKIPVETERKLKLDDNEVENILLTLCNKMESTKMYLNKDCTLNAVSIQTNIPTNRISHVINTRLKKKFTDFINEYRCRHANMLLEDKDSQLLTLEAIAIKKCGFSSRSNFIRAFKKYYGKTPSNYQKDLKKKRDQGIVPDKNNRNTI